MKRWGKTGFKTSVALCLMDTCEETRKKNEHKLSFSSTCLFHFCTWNLALGDREVSPGDTSSRRGAGIAELSAAAQTGA